MMRLKYKSAQSINDRLALALSANHFLKNIQLKLFTSALFGIALFMSACSPSEKNQDISAASKIPKLISETNGWHVLGGQTFPLSVGETPVQLQFENNHFSQSYQGMFYANVQNTTYDYARASKLGDSLYSKDMNNMEYNPFFYREGDVQDVRYGVYFAQAGAYSSHKAMGLYGIGPDQLDVNTVMYPFPPLYGGYGSSPGKFVNPHWFVYQDVQLGGIAAYRIGTNQVINMAGFYENDFAILFGANGLNIDEPYCIANPTHVKAYFTGSNNNVSINGHSRNFVSFYTSNDEEKTVFRDSTSQYITNSCSSCSDAGNVYYFFNNATTTDDIMRKNLRLLLVVFDKTTLKVTKKIFLGQDFSSIKELVLIQAKNEIYINAPKGLFKLKLSDYSITDITPKLTGDTGLLIPSFAICSDGQKLYATLGSYYMQYAPAVTNLIYYE